MTTARAKQKQGKSKRNPAPGVFRRLKGEQMAAPVGNRFWELRSSHGRNPFSAHLMFYGRRVASIHDAVARVRKYDDRTNIGMCSSHEIERLEKLALQLEKGAHVSQANEPLTRAITILAGLWSRYHNARSEVLSWQAELQRHSCSWQS
jgi:hypothetical protein